MLLFVCGDVEQVLVVGSGVAGVEEELLVHGADGTFVEDVLQVLEGQCILQDIDISDGCLTFVDWMGESGG